MIIKRQVKIIIKRIADQAVTSFGQLCTQKISSEAREINVNRSVQMLRDYLSRGRLMFEILVFSIDDLVSSIEPAVKRLRAFEDIEVIL